MITCFIIVAGLALVVSGGGMWSISGSLIGLAGAIVGAVLLLKGIGRGIRALVG